MTRYISTRGEAPELGFCDVMLTGLARDGGLYVPATWPQLSPDAIAGFFGRPYWEVAVEVIRPFVAGEISDAELGRMANEAYATFRHPAVVPLRQMAPHQFVLELFHGPTLAFKDVAMQLISRLMDHVLAQRGQRTTIVVATSGDTGGAAVDAFAGLENVDLIVLFPHGRISEVQRRMMTTTGAANVHALAVEGNFDDCQALVKAMFNNHRFRDATSLSGVNSINWARIVAQVVYYFTSAVAAGAPARAVDFVVPTGNFGDIFAGYVAKRMGLPVRTLGIAANVNDILARTLKTGIYEVREVHATASPSMDIQISSNFERLLFEAGGRDARRRAPSDGFTEAIGTLRAARCDAGRDPRGVRRRPGRRDRDRGRDPRRLARGRRAGRSPHRGRACGRRPRHHGQDGSQHRAVHRPSGQIPRCGRSGLRPAAATAGLARWSDDQIRTHEGDEERPDRGRAVRAVGQPRRETGSCRMSVEISKLASGLTVVTDKMPHLETAALGVWAGVGGRDEKPNEHGISHLLEHMAFKGTTKRSSREIVEEIEAVGGDLNAGTSTETTSYYARVLKADVPLALDVLADILANPAFEPDELEREKNVIVQEIGAAQDTPDDVVFEHLNELCYPDQPMGRSLLGTAKTLRAFSRDSLRDYLSTHYRGPDMVVAAAGRGRSQAGGRRGRAALCQF
ncbi:threonine synthase [Bradyrhizobium sp. GM6.1]